VISLGIEAVRLSTICYGNQEKKRNPSGLHVLEAVPCHAKTVVSAVVKGLPAEFQKLMLALRVRRQHYQQQLRKTLLLSLAKKPHPKRQIFTQIDCFVLPL
jgi:hypothetical protein